MTKIRSKKNKIRIIGGNWKHRFIPVVDAEGLRPSPDIVRETLFNWLGQNLTDLTCIDLFAGTGILGFEALSRGAKYVTMIEKNKLVYNCLLTTAQSLGACNANIIYGDVFSVANRLPQHYFDLAFVDPPFHSAILPDAILQATRLLKENGILYVEGPKPLEKFFESKSYVNPCWECIRHGKNGKVFYHLFRLPY